MHSLSNDSFISSSNNENINLLSTNNRQLFWINLCQFLIALPLLDSFEKFKLIVSIGFSFCLIIIQWSFSSFYENVHYIADSNTCSSFADKCDQIDNNSRTGQIRPIDQLASNFIVSKVLFSVLWSILWMRWTIACNYFTFNRSTYNLQRFGPIFLAFPCFILAAMSTGLMTTVSLSSSILIMILWYGTGSYFLGRLKANPLLLLLPAIALTVLELSATLQCDQSSSQMAVNIIECLLVTITGLLVTCGLDKSRCIQDLFPAKYPVYCSFERYNLLAILRQTLDAFFVAEIDLDQSIFVDFNVCLKILKHHCETLAVSLPFYTSSARIDVTIAYAFIRVSDDLVDDGRLNMDQRVENHKIILKFMDQLFSTRNEKWTYDVGHTIDGTIEPPVDWSFFKKSLPFEAYQVFRAYSRTVYYQPSTPMRDLVSTYSWDLEQKHIANEKQLIEFARCAGGGIMATFHIIQLYKSGLYPNGLTHLERPFIDTFYSIGQAMQLVNIARDIALDSGTDGRCYIPTIFMENAEKEIDILTNKKDPWALGVEKLSKYSKLIVALSYHCCSKTSSSMDTMPSQVKKPLMIFSEIYRTIGSQILKHSGFEKRIFVPLYRKIWIAFTYLYFNRKHI